MSDSRKKIFFTALSFAFILIFGSSGYMFFERKGFLDALYMTIVTVATVGYGDLVPKSPGGKIFTVFLILVGVGYVMYMFSNIVEVMIEGGLRDFLGKRQMKKGLLKMRDHFIVCGHGRIGQVICQTLHENNIPFVVIDNNPAEIEDVIQKGFFEIEGDAAEDSVLVRAGIKKARGLVSVVESDAENVYVTLTAKGLNPDVKILVRSSGAPGAEIKLMRAGADKVISPYFLGGRRMAQFIVKPNVIDFLELAMYTSSLGLSLEEILVSENSSIVGKTLIDSGIRKKHDIIVIGVKTYSEDMLFNPKPDTVINAGDILIVLGEKDEIIKLKKTSGG